MGKWKPGYRSFFQIWLLIQSLHMSPTRDCTSVSEIDNFVIKIVLSQSLKANLFLFTEPVLVPLDPSIPPPEEFPLDFPLLQLHLFFKSPFVLHDRVVQNIEPIKGTRKLAVSTPVPSFFVVFH